MGRRWTDEDVARFKQLAKKERTPQIAEKLDRTVGSVVFKAHTLKVSLRPREQGNLLNLDPGPAGMDLNE